METVTVAVVGAGVAGNFHCNAVKDVYSAATRLKTVVDTDPERSVAMRDKWGFQIATDDYESVLRDPEIDLICIALPLTLHADFSVKALKAGKHVVCEKPLTGYFGLPEEMYAAGDIVSKRKMYESLLNDMNGLRDTLNESKAMFMYAENYVYTPNILKVAEYLRSLEARVHNFAAECSINGPAPDLAELRKRVGSSALMRLAAYPLAGVLFFKQSEAETYGSSIRVTGVDAETNQSYTEKNTASENFVNISITFSDGSEATVYSCDKYDYDYTAGRMRNWVKLYCDNDIRMENTMIPADNMKTYFFDQEGSGDDWNNAWMQIEWMKKAEAKETYYNYVARLNKFIECASKNVQPPDGFSSAYDNVKIIYAACLSAEEGSRIYF